MTTIKFSDIKKELQKALIQRDSRVCHNRNI
jgi:hypothetical protein